MSPLSLLPTSWLIPAAAIGAAVLTMALGVQTYRLKGAQTDLAEQTASFSEQRLLASKAAQAAEAQQREIEHARLTALQERADEADRQALAARADVAIADAAAGRLQQRLAAYLAAARQASGNPAPPQAGETATDPAGVLADVFGRCVARVRFLADLADERGIAGTACEGSYDALSTDVQPMGYELPPAKLGGP